MTTIYSRCPLDDLARPFIPGEPHPLPHSERWGFTFSAGGVEYLVTEFWMPDRAGAERACRLFCATLGANSDLTLHLDPVPGTFTYP